MDIFGAVGKEGEHAFKNQQRCNQRLPLPVRELHPVSITAFGKSFKCKETGNVKPLSLNSRHASCYQSQDVIESNMGIKAKLTVSASSCCKFNKYA